MRAKTFINIIAFLAITTLSIRFAHPMESHFNPEVKHLDKLSSFSSHESNTSLNLSPDPLTPSSSKEPHTAGINSCKLSKFCKKKSTILASETFSEELTEIQSHIKTITQSIEINLFDKDNLECTQWVKAHLLCGTPYTEYEIAKILLKTAQFVKLTDFNLQMSHHLQLFYEMLKSKLKSKKYVYLIYDDGKSSNWIRKNFKSQLQALMKESEITLLSIESKELISNTKKLNLENAAFLRLDDAIYSGQQSEEYAKTLNTFFEGTAFAKPLNPENKIDYYFIAPYSSPKGRERLLAYANQAKNINLSLISENTIPNLESYFSSNPALFETLKKMYPRHGGWDGSHWLYSNLTNLFFEHKVPDKASVIEPFLRFGEVRCSNGESIKVKIEDKLEPELVQFNCVPWITPPYKSVSDYFRICPEYDLSPSCEKYRIAIRNLLQNIPSYHSFND